LGLLAHQIGKNDVAVELISKALTLKPNYIEAHINLGNALRAQGKLEEAVASYHQALALEPDHADAHYNLGNTFKDLGRLEEAVASYRRTLILKPDDAEAYNNLGIVLQSQNKHAEAVDNYRRALKIKPDNAEMYFNLGIILQDQGKQEEAVASYRRALTLNPNYAEGYYNLGVVLKDQGKQDEAIESFCQVLTLKPDFVDARIHLGNALIDKGKLDEAIACFRQVLSQKPDYAEVYHNLGNALMNQGKLQEADASYRQALSLKPDFLTAYSSLLFCMNYRSGIDQEEIYKESLQWGDRLLESFATGTQVFVNSLRTDRRLRIGYVSPDFRRHSVAFFIESVIRYHNRQKVEVFCYSNVKRTDNVTQRLQTEADHWFSIVGMDHEAVAARIKKDRIDVLVDLAGHTRENNLPVFARRAAPIQISWLGYPNTTGLRTMDFRLSDVIADPEGEADRLHSEKLVRLDHGFLCYNPAESTPEVGSLPYQERGHVTFGSFNNLIKVTPEVIKVWARILHAVPGSRLLLKAKQLKDDQNRARFKDMFAQESITPERLEMRQEMMEQADHLGLYNRVDIGLDPFPYNGTTTTCEALWMGVPIVTLLGVRHAGRVGASILHRVGLDELVASSSEEYIELARSLASDSKKLQEIRFSLRRRMQESELMNSVLFTGHLEDIYQKMWQTYCESVLSKQ
jgi:predicted O-linked N-acetylglucosamine transferase (SPINDLY family)